jgi:addiction module HigA family antidote
MPKSFEQSGHPGRYVREQMLDTLQLSVTEAADLLGITRTALSAFLNGRAALSSDMALRIEKVFGIPVDQLMHMQCDFDIAQARAREGSIVLTRYMPASRAPSLERRDNA